MVIECSSCHARFKLADDKIKENGTKVRCTKCREVFTVFPESTPRFTPPVATVAPVVTKENDLVDDTSFSLPSNPSPFEPSPSPAVSSLVSEEADWNQETLPTNFPDGFSNEAEASDLDAINFDNIEAPVFSVTTEKNNKSKFGDDIAFSFADSSFEDTTEQLYKITEPSDDQPLVTKNENKEESKINPIMTDGAFAFDTAENFDDFSWNETESTPGESISSEITQETPPSQQSTDFDFSSFSFDNEPVGGDANEDKSDDTATQSETTIELSTEPEVSPATPLTNQPSTEAPSLSPIVTTSDYQDESTPPPAKSIRPRSRPRSRQKIKSSARLLFKVILAIFLLLILGYGIINREQIQKEYKNLVSGFIENQVPSEASGRIGLIKLTGGYLFNSQKDDYFVIHGEAVNESKGLRSSVLVRGTIYGENGEIIQSQSAYCGNPLKDNILNKLEFKEIRDRMNNELGENLVNLNIAPGKSVPFTIVFNQVPKNIKEFTVEVLNSKPGSK